MSDTTTCVFELPPSPEREPLAAYVERAVYGSCELVAVIEAVEDDEVRERLRIVAKPLLWDVVMLGAGTTELLLRA